jgi:hypothetical protein
VPLVATPKFDRFLLTKTNYACGFCPPPGPTEAIEVRLAKQRIAATLDEIRVAGGSNWSHPARKACSIACMTRPVVS